MKSVLAVFAKDPLPGKVKTRLTPALSPVESAELYRCMLRDTAARVGGMPVERVVFFEGAEPVFRDLFPDARLIHQAKGGLGERLEKAFAALSGLGYGARVVVGTDAPDLPLGYIEQAFRLLAAGNDAVFGPAEDGGYYLVALGGASGSLFRDIPWSTHQVLETSLQRARAEGFKTALLPSWYDIDSFEDLQRPGLADPGNGAPHTRAFLLSKGITRLPQPDEASLPAG